MNSNVSVVRCGDYELKNVKAALDKSICDIGGIGKYINKGERVLLKVNLLMKKSPEAAATTHPAFVQALCELITEFGAEVIIGDSPGGPFNERMLKGIYKATGMEDVSLATGCQLNYNVKFAERQNENGLLLKHLTVADMINDVDKIISVSKLKTHGLMTFTGAVKNMFGIVPGIMKAEYHLNMPEKTTFANALIDICLCARPVLSFMDGIVGMEGSGPSGGDPKKINAVITSDSPYHLDKVACSIINLNYSRVYTINNCIDRGLCNGDLSDVTLFCDEGLEAFKVKDFNVPATKDVTDTLKVPKPLRRLLNSWLQSRPVFDYKKCIGCCACMDNCPAKVIKMEDKKPIADLTDCIRCYCCQELCPEKAVSVYRPALVKLFISK